jgi:hypothetical protein
VDDTVCDVKLNTNIVEYFLFKKKVFQLSLETLGV